MMENKSKYFSEDLIYRINEEISKEKLLGIISRDLTKKGYVTEDFKELILDRENDYPTGLPGNVNIAIPHTYPQHIKNEFIAVVILKEPVQFIKMATENDCLDVSIVFILGYKTGEYQVRLLQILIDEFINGKGGSIVRSIDDDKKLVDWFIENIETKLNMI